MSNFKLNQKGLIPVAILLILLTLSVGVGVYLVSQQTNIIPHASNFKPRDPGVGFVLEKEGPQEVRIGQDFEVHLLTFSDFDSANLFSAKLNFNKDQLQVQSIEASSSSIVKFWVDKKFDNDQGLVSLIGAIPNPGIKTEISTPPQLMATIHFIAKQTGKTEISFDDKSSIFRNSDNINILSSTTPLELNILGGEDHPQPVSSVSPASKGEGGHLRLSMDPPTGNFNKGCSFATRINLDNEEATGDSQVSFAYDPSRFYLEKITNGQIIKTPNFSINNIKGVATISSPNQNPQITGKGLLATLYFKVLDQALPGTAIISFSGVKDLSGNGSYTIGSDKCKNG